jgi:hypothetical protein
MSTFTVDSDHNIVAHAGTPASADGQLRFSSEKDLAKLAADWPSSRLIEIWNSFAGVTPFDDLKPVKRFTNRERAVRRIWDAVARLADLVSPEPTAAQQSRAKAKPAKIAKIRTAPEPRNKKAQVIALMRRSKGVTLHEIIRATGWQKHTVRGFVSIVGSKGGEKIESAKNTAGERNYRITK